MTAIPSTRACAVLLLAVTAVAAVAAEGTGCRPPTPDEQAWMDANLVVPDAVLLNRTAIERINAERSAAGQPALDLEPAADAAEVVGRTVRMRAMSAPPVVRSAPPAVPAVVDNSLLNAFPPVGSQGSLGSCACYSTTYYTMTHMVARARGINAKTGGAATRYSPKFCYNLINGGSDNGSWITSAYQVQLNHGVPTLAAWPYDSDYRSWPTTAAVWRNAIPSRMGTSGAIYGVDSAAGLLDLKRMLANGYVLNFATDIYGWQFTTLANDPGTAADDAFVGQQVCHWYKTDNSGHAMTVVGYNDNLWVDLNGNGTVEAGEKGALKIVNNWGSGWKNSGCAWIMYDALKAVSAVSGWSGGTGRTNAWWGGAAYWITARPAHVPTVLGEFTLNTAKRSEVIARLGLSSTATTTPSTLLSSSLWSAGGAYAFNGTTTAIDATFVLDFTDRIPAGNARCYVSVQDTSALDPCLLSNARLTDGAGATLATITSTSPAGGLPYNVDWTTVTAWADISTSDATAPAAISDLATTLVAPNAITLTWTASGDDGASGTASTYDVRYASSPITAGTWAAATPATGEPTPKASGSSETFQLSGLAAGATYHLAVVAIDDAGNAGPLSNVVVESTPSVLTITSPSPLPAADLGVAYATTLAASGGTGARTWTAVTGHAERNPGSSVVPATGTARGWQADTGSWTYTFPAGFTFPFAGSARSSVRVSSDGYLEFGSSVTSKYGSDSTLKAAAMIAVAWYDLTTAGSGQAGEDIYIHEAADAVTIRWVGEWTADPDELIDAQATLHRDGTIELAYRRSANLSPYIGVSDGDSVHWGRSDRCWTLLVAGTRRTWDYLTWPAGLTLAPATGQLSGTMSQAGVHKLGLGVSDSGYPVQSANAVLTLVVGKPAITSALSAGGVASTPFSYQITASNSPTTFSASGLPAGLSCSSSGLISGTPTAAGVSSATITAGNAAGSDAETLTITIAVHPPVISSALSASANAGMPFSYQITAGFAPTSFSASGLPAGLSCNASGLISGSPVATGTANVTISAANAGGSGSATLTITTTLVAPTTTSPSTAAGTIGSPFSYQITAIGAPASFSASGLPPGLSCTGAGLISGTPTASGSYTVAIHASNAAGTGSATLTIAIAAAGTPAPAASGGGGGGGSCGAGALAGLLAALLALSGLRRRS